MLGFVTKLGLVSVPVLFYVVVSDDPRATAVIALLVVGAFAGWHLLRAHMVGDDDVWDPVSVRSFELPLPRDEVAASIVRVLAAREDAEDVQRSAFTITCVVGRKRTFGLPGWSVTIMVVNVGGGSRVELDVEPGGGFGRGVLDFGAGHRLVASIEHGIREQAAARIGDGAHPAESDAPRGGTESVPRG